MKQALARQQIELYFVSRGGNGRDCSSSRFIEVQITDFGLRRVISTKQRYF